MKCGKCSNNAVIELQHGLFCQKHFLNYFEEKVFHTISKYRLIDRNDKVCVAASGGKDSLAVLYLTRKYFQKNKMPLENIFALLIDEGIANYRDKTIKDLQVFCRKFKIKLNIVKCQKEFGYTLDDAYPLINKKTKKKPCNICGVWRRYLINKYARNLGATKLVTGHNLDDEAQAIIMNTFKANTSLAAHLGPISGIQEHHLFVQRVKPLYFCSEKETRLYCLLKKFEVRFGECPYAEVGYRAHVRDMLNDFEHMYKGTKQGIINSFLDILPLIKEKKIKGKCSPLKPCSRCQEPANQEICNACQMVEDLQEAND